MTRHRKARLLYPVDVKPASDISTWNGWPDDVRDILMSWNKGKGLSFRRGRVFKCTGCERFCERHGHGAAEIHHRPYCDDCLIELARSGYKPVLEGWLVEGELWRGGGIMGRRPSSGRLEAS